MYFTTARRSLFRLWIAFFPIGEGVSLRMLEMWKSLIISDFRWFLKVIGYSFFNSVQKFPSLPPVPKFWEISKILQNAWVYIRGYIPSHHCSLYLGNSNCSRFWPFGSEIQFIVIIDWRSFKMLSWRIFSSWFTSLFGISQVPLKLCLPVSSGSLRFH